MERIKSLRLAALKPNIRREEFFYNFFKRFHDNGGAPKPSDYAEAFFGAFDSLTPSISDGELIVGRSAASLSPEKAKEWDEVYYPMARKINARAGGGQHSHMAIDYELILERGINGIIDRIDSLLDGCDEDKISFYKCCRKCLEAVIRHSENYAAKARELAEQADDPKRREELLKISEICLRVPANPAESFWEAVQSVHFVTHCITLNPLRIGFQQFQLGHPDRYLYPYYKKDIENGAITKEFAQLLLDCLGIQINMRVPSGLSSGYMVGGRDWNGGTVSNELTQMCMRVIDDIRLVYPAVGLCYTEDMDPSHLETACRILLNGRSHPAIFNDDVITRGLMNYGVPESQAHDYIHSTCVEITPTAASNVWVASPYTNMAQILLDALEDEYSDFDALFASVLERLDVLIKANFEVEIETRKRRAAYSMNPLLSCFVNDCLERGLDIENGGATYNWIMPSFVGVANLVDSLYAVKEIVFDKKELTLPQLREILSQNFEGDEALRARLMNAIPKYGNDIDAVDQYFGMITEHIISECKKYVGIHSNARLIPSVFCWIMHEQFGTETGATPDGRLAGFPLGDGSGPCQGREMCGPTASILSSTKWDHSGLIGGVAVNMKFSKSSLGASSCATMGALVRTFMARGGFEIQINVTDRETLLRATKHPEEYRDLVVRIGGYSDYFVRLSKEMQSEVILRTEHGI